MRRGLLAAALLLSFSDLIVADEPPVEIPLSEIWANCAKDARPLRDLEPELFVNLDTPERIAEYSTPEAQRALWEKSKESLVLRIENSLRRLRSLLKTPKRGFAVVGVDRAALQGVHGVLVNDEMPRDGFSDQDPITVVFFTRPTRVGLTLERIEWHGRVLQIHYTLHSHGRLALMSNLAFIPLGTLPPEEYQVELVRTARTDRDQRGFPPVEPDAERDIVCESFEFAVTASDD